MEGGSSYGCDLDNLKATELRLGLPGSGELTKPSPRGCKRAFSDTDEASRSRIKPSSESDSIECDQDLAPVAKAQVVGWPPVRSYRRKNFLARKAESEAVGIYVKVRMDGAPYLRKIDLKVYKGYKDLREALEEMFKCFSLGEGCNGSEHAVTYEDKDGDWMLVGDVPWGMFINSCKRLRIMKSNEARGLGSNA